VFTIRAVAQPPNYGQWPLELGARGFISGAPYDLSSFDSINAVNGNVVLSVPLAALPAGHAGSGLNLTLNYNSSMFDAFAHYVQNTGTTYSFHTDTFLLPPFSNEFGWYYGYQYGLYEETREAEPVVIGTGPQEAVYSNGCVPLSGGGLDLMNSSTSALYPVRVYALFPDGSSHVLFLTNGGNSSILTGAEGWSGIGWNALAAGCTAYESNGFFPLQYITQDGTFVRVTVTGMDGGSPVWIMQFPDGRNVTGLGTAGQAQTISDRNGNKIAISAAGTTVSPCFLPLQDASDPVTTIKDAYGRCIQIEQGLAVAGEPSTDWITQAAASSTTGPPTLITKVSWSPEGINFVYNDGASSCQFLQQYFGNGCDPGPGIQPACTTQGACEPPAILAMVTSIDLSEAGVFPQGTPLSYTFGYSNTTDPHGYTVCGACQVTDVTLPQGSSTSWQAPKIHYNYTAPEVVSGQPFAGVSGKTLTHTDPYTGTTYTDTWQYTPQFLGTNATVVNPNGSSTIHFSYPPGTEGPLDGHVFRTDKYDASGNLLSRIEQMWTTNTGFGTIGTIVGPNVFLKADFRSVVPPGSTTPSLSAIRIYNEDVNGNVGEVDESDWVQYSTVTTLTHDGFGGISQLPSLTSSSAARSTINSYYVLADAASNIANAYWSATAPAILNAKKSTEILGYGTVKAYSEFLYDDPTEAGSNPASGAGNVTQQWRWDSTQAPTFPGATQSGGYSLMLSASNAIETIRTYGAGDVLTETDPRKNPPTVLQYNSSAHPYPTDLFDANGSHWQFVWDPPSGLRTSETDPNKAIIAAGYDPRGRPALLDQAGLRHTTTTYNDATQTAVTTRSVTSSSSVVTTSSTDDLGRVWKTQSTDGSCTSEIQTISLQQTPPSGAYAGYTWKLESNPFCASNDPTMGWTRTKLDPLGRVVEVAHFTGSGLPAPWGSNAAGSGAVETSYNANQYTVTDETGLVSRTMTDNGLNQLSSVLDGSGVTTGYSYDALDDLTGVTQSAQQRSFVYTSLGRLQSAQNPESGTVSYTWDLTGNLATRADARVTATMSTSSVPYDKLNRLVMKSYSDGITPPVTYCYDGQVYGGNPGQCTGMAASPSIGRLTEVASSVSTTNYTLYDLVGRVLASTQTTNGTPYPFTYSYNMLDGLTQEQYPSGRMVNYTYDAGGRVQTVSGTMNSVQTAYAGSSTNAITYAPHHALSMLPLGSGITESWSYNDRLQATQMQAGSLITLNFYPCDAGSTACSTNNGNIWREKIQSSGMSATATQEYRYDTLNRLVVAVENPSATVGAGSTCGPSTGGTWCQQFGYDVYGNRWVNTYSGIMPPANTPQSANNFDTANHLTANLAQSDAGGNQQQIGGSTGTGYTYDAENRLVTVTSLATSTTIASYAYDGEGRRVQRVSGQTTTYVYDEQGLLAAEVTGTPPAAACMTCYLTTDHLGSTRLMTDNQGNPIALHDYQPFGEEIPCGVGGRNCPLYGQADDPRQKFTGKERDSELANSADPYGLDYFGARYYSAAQGRFTSPDLLGGHLDDPQTLNKYAYVRNSPLRFTDPTGLDLQAACDQESDTCHKQHWYSSERHEGTWDQDHKHFTVTHFQTDESGNLAGHSINFDASGIHVDGHQASFIPGTDPTRVNGTGDFSATHFVANSNCLGTCEAGGGLFANDDGAFLGVGAFGLKGPNPGIDRLGEHPGDQYRGGNTQGPTFI